MEQDYVALRYFKSGKAPQIMKRNLTIEQAREFVIQYESTKNSFVGFTKVNNLNK